MTEQEYTLLDELYFLTPFDALKTALGWEEKTVLDVLEQVNQKSWLRVYITPSNELLPNEINIAEKGKGYSYNASKAGLFALNQI
jgi:hypothetical protein